MVAVVSSALAAAEPHSLAPPCDHSAEVPVPFMPQPGALAFKGFCHDGFSTGSPLGCVAKPRMSSASYQRYSATRGVGDGVTRGGGDAATQSHGDEPIRRANVIGKTQQREQNQAEDLFMYRPSTTSRRLRELLRV